MNQNIADKMTLINHRIPGIHLARPWYVPILLFILLLSSDLHAQSPELETAVVKVNEVWVGVKANGDKGNFDYRLGFFPNDYEILGARGQQWDTWGGAGFRLATTNWPDPIEADSIHSVAVYGPTNDFMPNGRVVDGGDLVNHIRSGYPTQIINGESYIVNNFGDVNPDAFGYLTADQLVEVTTENILGVQLNRQVMAWGQNFHDDYVVVDVEFTNTSGDTLFDFYINIQSNGDNTYRSNGSNPLLLSGEGYNSATTWQHYYGGRIGDSLRVFYEYSADEPDIPGDDMGAPIISQNGRLINNKFVWYSILHASIEPYLNADNDVDDFKQPRVTYIGKDNLIPYDNGSDEYGSSNYWAIRGAYSEFWPMTGNLIPGTFHGGNSDETGSTDYSDFPAGTRQGNNSKMWSSFGPYTFLPDHKLHIALASGYSGLDAVVAQQIGSGWQNGTLTDAPGLPDARTGYFPSNFAFPQNATEMDKIKDRWLSTAVDSVMKSASRAKWNFETGYQVPQAPPPPSHVEIRGRGTGVEIKWTDWEAEERPDFAGYRIMRRLSSLDTRHYEEIYSSGAEDLATEHTYVDTDIIVGVDYYYYIQAKALIATDDMNAYPENRGKIIYSSRVLHPNQVQIIPPHFSQNDLEKIAIVPNPYNINDPVIEFYYGKNDLYHIGFYNLPTQIDIDIYTETGDWVQTLHHYSEEDESAGDESWDLISHNQQVVNSGIYIAVFKTHDGRSSYQKFVIIR